MRDFLRHKSIKETERYAHLEPGSNFDAARAGDYFRRRVSMFPSQPALVRGIPPGEYHLGLEDGRRCHRVIELLPRSTARVELDAGSCLVAQMPPGL